MRMSCHCLEPRWFVGDPTSLARDKTRGQGSFGPFTGGLNITPMGEPPTCGANYLSNSYLQKFLDLRLTRFCQDRLNLARHNIYGFTQFFL